MTRRSSGTGVHVSPTALILQTTSSGDGVPLRGSFSFTVFLTGLEKQAQTRASSLPPLHVRYTVVDIPLLWPGLVLFLSVSL